MNLYCTCIWCASVFDGGIEITRDDIIRMAREAGIFTGGHPMSPWSVYPSDLERFAALVAAAEREACARECDEFAEQDRLSNYYAVAARAIRARGENK